MQVRGPVTGCVLCSLLMSISVTVLHKKDFVTPEAPCVLRQMTLFIHHESVLAFVYVEELAVVS